MREASTSTMPKSTAAVLATLLALTLVGCTGTPASAPSEPTAAVETAVPESGTDLSTVTAAPVVIEPVPTPTDPTEGMTPEEAYLYEALPDLEAWGTTLTEEEALSAGLYVCEQLVNVRRPYEIKSLVNASAAANGVVVREALEHLCP